MLFPNIQKKMGLLFKAFWTKIQPELPKVEETVKTLTKLINTGEEILSTTADVTVRVYKEAANAVMDAFWAVKKLALVAVFALSGSVVIIDIGFIIHNSIVVGIGTLIAGLVFAFFWKVPNIFRNFIKKTFVKLPFVGKSFESIAELVDGIAKTFLNIGFAITCIGAFTVMANVAEWPLYWLLVISLVALAIILYFEYYLASPGWRKLMLTVVLVTLLYNVVSLALPEQTDNVIAGLFGNSREIVISSGVQLYRKEGKVLVADDTTKKETIVRFRSYFKDEDGNQMYEVVMPTGKGYRGGQHRYVEKIYTSDYSPDVKQVNNSKVSSNVIPANYTPVVTQQITAPKLVVPAVQDTIISFNASGKTSSNLVLMNNYKVRFVNPTAGFRIPWGDGTKKLITENYRAVGDKDNEHLEFYGAGKSGSVEVIIEAP